MNGKEWKIKFSEMTEKQLRLDHVALTILSKEITNEFEGLRTLKFFIEDELRERGLF